MFDSRHYARGVIYRRNHHDIEVHANKEVILCAGVFNTPKLLMLSGVGPSQHLRDSEVGSYYPSLLASIKKKELFPL